MTRKSFSKEIKAIIREQVLNGKSKTQVARDFNVSYKTVCNYTKDILLKNAIPKKIKNRVRNDVIEGNTKYQTAKRYNLSETTVYRITKDIQSNASGWYGIRGKTLSLLQEIVSKGYVYPKGRYVQQQYRILKKYFPKIRRITIYCRPIIYLEGKEDVAARAYLERVNKKIISYQELKQVTKVFGVDLSKREKEAFLLKKRGKRGIKNQGVLKEDSLLKNDDSFSFFYIRNYCINILKILRICIEYK